MRAAAGAEARGLPRNPLLGNVNTRTYYILTRTHVASAVKFKV